MTDGLDHLYGRRELAATRRQPPRPRNPVDRSTPARLPDPKPAKSLVRTPSTTPHAPVPISLASPGTHDTQGGRVKPAQFQIDETTEAHLKALREAAQRVDLPVNNSLLMRRALAAVVDEHGYEGFIEWVAQSHQRRPGRPRLDA